MTMENEVGAVLETVKGSYGMEAVITVGAKGFHVTLRDAEADESFPSVWIFPTIDRARAWALTVAE